MHADIGDADSLRRALDGQEAAYYLVHSLAVEDFAVRDREGAIAFAAAATGAGLSQVVYLGGLGDDRDDLSEHLRSRREVESILRDGAPTTALRAGIVIGDGSISWEILRQLVERLPVMITPRWVQTKTQPIALDDALVDLVGVLGRPDTIGEVYDIGGPEVLTYLDMMVIASRVMDRHRVIVAVPLLSPRLSSHWLRLITDVDLTTARALVDSLTNEVVVRDHRLDELLGHTPMMFAEAAAKALGGESGASGGRRGPCASLTCSSLPPSQRLSMGRRRAADDVSSPPSTIVVGTALLAATLRVPARFGVVHRPRPAGGGHVDGRIVRLRTDPVPARSRRGVAHVRRTRRRRCRSVRGVPRRLPGRPSPARSSAPPSTACWPPPMPAPLPLVLFVALVNGAGEELFFRGALHAALEPHRPAVAATIVYVVVTAATGNVALVIAAAVMGVAVQPRAPVDPRGPRPDADPPDVVDADGPRPPALTAASIGRRDAVLSFSVVPSSPRTPVTSTFR